jgi:hypothetical protein
MYFPCNYVCIYKCPYKNKKKIKNENSSSYQIARRKRDSEAS